MCSKVRHETKLNALQALAGAARARMRGDEERQESNIYRCRECGGAWHLTHYPAYKDATFERSPRW